MKDQVLFPKIEVREKGFLKVSDIHTIYWERSGNPKGKKILVIHGGPGGGSQPRYRSKITAPQMRLSVDRPISTPKNALTKRTARLP